MNEALLEVRDVHVRLPGGVRPLRGVSFAIAPGGRLGVVGESGSGKSMTAAAILRQLPTSGPEMAGAIAFAGRDMAELGEEELRRVRGAEIAVVFQNARAALNPLFTVGEQIADVYRIHTGSPPKEAWDRAVELLRRMGVEEPERRALAYPHELSGGQCQRAMIAMAVICTPRLLIADEPTTGLDATIEEQVLELVRESVTEAGAAFMLISHDLGVVRESTDELMVMYAGEVFELGPAALVLEQPANPYTKLLIECAELGEHDAVRSIPGRAPDAHEEHAGCAFAPRCPLAADLCREERPVLRRLDDGRSVTCHRAEECRDGAA